jgi:hypothetical protein
LGVIGPNRLQASLSPDEIGAVNVVPVASSGGSKQALLTMLLSAGGCGSRQSAQPSEGLLTRPPTSTTSAS